MFCTKVFGGYILPVSMADADDAVCFEDKDGGIRAAIAAAMERGLLVRIDGGTEDWTEDAWAKILEEMAADPYLAAKNKAALEEAAASVDFTALDNLKLPPIDRGVRGPVSGVQDGV